MGLFKKILNVGEGRKLKLLETIVPGSTSEPEMERRSDAELAALPSSSGSASPRAKTDDLMQAFAARARRGAKRPGPAALRRPGHGWRRPALRLGRRDEDR
jgi:hypothetical protein